ncbi:pentapeptide repeat-containing protein [Curtobacterium pusillum]|uniref:pentapeptide repeat-containing protein n=1 Tax=Curtobacterium pusillum TaxID=69373 RepID=UPI0011A5AEC4|nr:pentapeptide repeat-containing protein [Curtobacterium pusillum]
MPTRTRVELGRRADLGADCANCFGLCCVALAFAKSADFPFDKAAGDPCTNLDETDGCRIHPHLRERGFAGCTVFDCSGAGQKVSRHTFAGRSWRDDAATQRAMFATFPVVRRLHELLRYLDEAITLVHGRADDGPWVAAFERVLALSDGSPEELAAVDVDAEYDRARPLLLEASEIVRGAPAGNRAGTASRSGSGARPGPGSDLVGADLRGADLRGATLRGSTAIAADLRGARLDRCDLLGVDLRDADLGGADLGGAVFLTQMQVNSARGDAGTVLPVGFRRPAHWNAGTGTTGSTPPRRGPSGRAARSRRR